MTFDSVLSKKEIRKIFGKGELEIIGKQRNGLALTQSEKNRLSRDIRAKLKAVRMLADYEAEFSLRKDQRNLSIIQDAVRTIKQRMGDDAEAIVLFGSRADRTHSPDSDIDICVVSGLNRREASERLIQLAGELPENVDIHMYSLLPEKVRRSIVSNHKMLFRMRGFRFGKGRGKEGTDPAVRS